MQNWR